MVEEIIMSIPTDAIVMTIALIVGFIYFRTQKKLKILKKFNQTRKSD